MRIGYARDVKLTPDIEIQIEMLKSANCKKIFVSRKSIEKADIIKTTNNFIREGEDTLVVCKLLCLDTLLKEMIIFFHQLDNRNLSFESIEDNLIVDRNHWSIVFKAIHLYQNFKQISSEEE